MPRIKRERTVAARGTAGLRSDRRRKVAVAAALALAASVGVGVWSATSNRASASSAGDGTSTATAAPSCWSIKQQYPASPDGEYWLSTPALGAPQQFYCDMTTDGGGWVLVGRGRDGWSFTNEGQGSSQALHSTVDGPAAFKPAALSNATIDALMGGTALKDQPDGIRIRRARTVDGSVREEWRFRMADRTTWSWQFGAGFKLASTQFGGVTYPGGNTRDTAVSVNGNVATGLAGNTTNRILTSPIAWSTAREGFLLPGAASANTSTAYMFSTNGLEPAGFTQVYIRPRVNSVSWPVIGTDGPPAVSQPEGLSNRAQDIDWGVNGYDRTDEERVEPYNTPVMDIEVANGRTYVGGRYASVKNFATSEVVNQRFLSAFDEATGELRRDFTPAVNGRVWDIIPVANGNIVIGGDFTSVNGAPNTAGLAMLDGATGAVIPSFVANVLREDGSGKRAIVRAIDVQGGYLYAVGNFNRYRGGTWNKINVGRAVKIDLTNGNPVGTWKPVFPASPVDVFASSAGDRVYAVGFFKAVNRDTTKKYVGVVDQDTGALVPGLNQWAGEINYGDRYQQTVIEVGDKVGIGGAEHIFQLFDRSNLARTGGGTAFRGGDFQESAVVNGRLYASCHCADYYFNGTRSWSSYPASYTDAGRISYVAEIDPATGHQNTDFLPDVSGTGDGVWAIEQGDNSCLWIGGYLTAAGGRPAGGFAKFCPKDTTPPPAPQGLSATPNANGSIALSWNASAGATEYWIYRDDRPIVATVNTNFVDASATGSHRYWVQAVDAAGNRSSTTPAVNAAVAGGGQPPLVALGATWKYSASTTLPADWMNPSFNDAGWASGAAQLGWGDGDEATVLPGQPVTSYFRSAFQVANVADHPAVEIGVIRDDGAIVYVNGVEVLRTNMPAGPVNASTQAVDYISGGAENQVVPVVIPGALLQTGTNTIAVELHQRTVANGDATMDARVSAVSVGADTQAPGTFTASATSVTSNAVTLSWSAASDNVATLGYVIARDGQKKVFLPATATTYTDPTVTGSTAYAYSITAYDAAGNQRSASLNVTTPASQATLVGFGSQWRWYYSDTAPAANWTATNYDASSWAVGGGELGYGDGDEATVISTAPAPRPLVANFRTSVNVANPAAFGSFELKVRRDDGVVVYVNGVEVARDNMPAGAATNSTPSATTIDTRAAETTPVTFTIPNTAFTAGSNTIAVSVHNAHRWSGDLSFDLELTGMP